MGGVGAHDVSTVRMFAPGVPDSFRDLLSLHSLATKFATGK
nr:hypothetical protein [Bradyrhizobium sp. 2S1]